MRLLFNIEHRPHKEIVEPEEPTYPPHFRESVFGLFLWHLRRSRGEMRSAKISAPLGHGRDNFGSTLCI